MRQPDHGKENVSIIRQRAAAGDDEEVDEPVLLLNRMHCLTIDGKTTGPFLLLKATKMALLPDQPTRPTQWFLPDSGAGSYKSGEGT